MAWYDVPKSKVAALLAEMGVGGGEVQISSDAGNALTLGTDNKLFVPPGGGSNVFEQPTEPPTATTGDFWITGG